MVHIFGNYFNRVISQADSEPEKALELYEHAFEQFCFVCPEISEALNKHIDDAFTYTMSKIAIKNYYHGGFADGYSVPGGKLEPDKFAITSFTTPSEVVVQHQKSMEYTPDIQRSSDVKSEKAEETSKDLKGQFEKIKFLDDGFNKVLNISNTPEKIQLITLPGKRTQKIMIATINGERKVVDYPLLRKSDEGELYSAFKGNVDVLIISRIEDDLSKSPQNEKDDIISQYKQFNPDYDETYIEDDAIEWYAARKYGEMSEEEKEDLRRKELAQKEKFVVLEKDGEVVVSPMSRSGANEVYEGITVYDRDGDGQYNKLFESIRDEKMPLSNYHASLYETEAYKRILTYMEQQPANILYTFKEQAKVANQLYVEANNSMGFAGTEDNYAVQKIGKNPNISKLMKKNPRAFELLKYLAEEEAKINRSGKLSYLSAAVRICNDSKNDYDEQSQSKEQ